MAGENQNPWPPQNHPERKKRALERRLRHRVNVAGLTSNRGGSLRG